MLSVMAGIEVLIMVVAAVVAISGRPTGCSWKRLNGSEGESWTLSFPLSKTLPAVVTLPADNTWQEFTFIFELSDNTPVGSLKLRKVGEFTMLTLKRLSESGSASVHMSEHQQQVKVRTQVFQQLSPTNETFLNLSLNDMGYLRVELDGADDVRFNQVDATDFYQVYGLVSQSVKEHLSFDCKMNGKVFSALPIPGVFDDPQRPDESSTGHTESSSVGIVIGVILTVIVVVVAAITGLWYYKRTRRRANEKRTIARDVVNEESCVNEEKELLMIKDGKQNTVDGVQDACVKGVKFDEGGRQAGVAGVIGGVNNREGGVRVEPDSEDYNEEGVTVASGSKNNEQRGVLDEQDGSTVGMDDMAGGQEAVQNSKNVLQDRTESQTHEKQIKAQDDQRQPKEASVTIHFNYKTEECDSQPTNVHVTLDNQIKAKTIIVKLTERSKAPEMEKNGTKLLIFFSTAIDGKAISDLDEVDEADDAAVSIIEQEQTDDKNINQTLMNQNQIFIRSDGADCHQDINEATSRVHSDNLMNIVQTQMQTDKSGEKEQKIRLADTKDNVEAKDKGSKKLTHISSRETISPAIDGERKDDSKNSSLSETTNAITDVETPDSTKHSSEVSTSKDDPTPPSRIQDASQEVGNVTMDQLRRNQVVREEEKSHKPMASENVSRTNNTENEMSTRNTGDSSKSQHIENIAKIDSVVKNFQGMRLGHEYPQNKEKKKSKVRRPYYKSK